MAINKRLLVKPPATGIVPSEHFGVVLYEGDGSSSHSINGGKFGAASYFNGTSSKVNISSFGDVFKNNFSFSLWFNLNTIPTSGIVSLFTTFNDYYCYAFIRDSDKKVEVRVENASTGYVIKSTSTFGTYGVWHHLAVTKSSSDGLKIYINGSLENTDATATVDLRTMSRDSLIGAYNAAGTTQYYLEGKIDQVRIFTKALSSSEVSTLYAETAETVTSLEPLGNETTDTLQVLGDSSCIATYRFENNEDDLSGNNNGTGTEIQYAVGRYGQAASFNGSTSKVDTSLTLDTYTSNGGSISFWFKTSQTTPFQAIIGSQTAQNGASYGTVIFIGDTTSTSSSESISVWDRNGSTTSMFYTGGGSTTYQDGNWHHVVVTSTSTTKNIYIDGVSQTVSYALSGSASANLKFTDIQFGASLGYTGTNYFDGQLDQVRIFNKALSASEVTTLYNENSLVASYRFEGNANDDTRNYDASASNVTYEYGLNGFTPDLVWIHARTATDGPVLYDTTRGIYKRIYSHATSTEQTLTTSLISFDTGGFSLGSSTNENNNGTDYVAWCFKAGGGTTSSNTDGTITSTVQANQDAGFSIVTWTGNSSNASIGHGLSTAPDMILAKSRTVAQNWAIYHKDVGPTYWMRLNGTTAKQDEAIWQDTAPSDSVFYVNNNVVINSGNSVAYCFHSVEGFSSFGSYTGATPSQPIVETGFEPAFIMIKRTDTAGYDWNIYDNRRDTVNPNEAYLEANTSDVEASGRGVNFLSNGFQLYGTSQSINGSGGTYIYMAFAADPDTEAPTVAKSFSTITYTGNGTSLDLDTGFKPGLIWTKPRSYADNNQLWDIVRGAGWTVYSNSTNAENPTIRLDGVSSFNDDGFSIGNWNNINVNGSTYVAWAWKADDNEPTIDGGPAVAVYKFEDNSNDVTTNYNLTSSNLTYNSSGKFNKSAVFNGSSSYAQITSSPPQFGNKMSVSFWAKSTSTSRSEFFLFEVSDGGSGTHEYLSLENNGYGGTNSIRCVYNNAQAINVNNESITDGNWHHFVVSVDSSTLKVYKDGTEIASASITAVQKTILQFRVGYRGYNNDLYFDGEIDQLRLYNGALKQEQVTELYNETASQNNDLTLGAPPETIISANANSGFSIVKFQANGGSTITPHGLSSAPEMIIYKNLDIVDNWYVYHKDLSSPNTQYLNLNTTAAATTNATNNFSSVTATTFTSYLTNGTENIIAYCFHSVAGYSKIGSYTGNGTTNAITGLGFQPDWVMIKSATTAQHWVVQDSVRGAGNRLYPSADSAEGSTNDSITSFDSNGFTVGASLRVNDSGQTFIYMAFKIN